MGSYRVDDADVAAEENSTGRECFICRTMFYFQYNVLFAVQCFICSTMFYLQYNVLFAVQCFICSTVFYFTLGGCDVSVH